MPDFLGLMDQVFDQVERAPVTVPVTDPRTNKPASVTINKFALQVITASSFGSWEAALPAWFQAMSLGDFSVAARRWVSLIRERHGHPRLGDGLYDGLLSRAYRRTGSGKSGRRRSPPYSATSSICPNPPSATPGEIRIGATPSAGILAARIPVLFISGTFDVRTPVTNAEEVRRGFPNSEHLIIEGAVHSDPLFLSSPKIKDAMLAFMKGNKIPTSRIELPPLKFQPVGKSGGR